jgi:small subunit ribosomal protein S2
VIAVVDSNCDPEDINFPIPGNDDAGRAITLYCDLVARAAIDGIERAQHISGMDIGESEDPYQEDLGDGSRRRGRGGKGPQRKRREGDGESVQESGSETVSAVVGLPGPAGEPDDLLKINGVNKALAKKLNDYGVYQFSQLANLSQSELEELDKAMGSKGRIVESDWVAQAKKLVEESA